MEPNPSIIALLDIPVSCALLGVKQCQQMQVKKVKLIYLSNLIYFPDLSVSRHVLQRQIELGKTWLGLFIFILK